MPHLARALTAAHARRDGISDVDGLSGLVVHGVGRHGGNDQVYRCDRR